MTLIRFCFINTKAAIKTASSELIEDNSEYGKGSKGGICEKIPAFTMPQPAKIRIWRMTNEIVPIKPPIASVMAPLRELGRRASFSTRMIFSAFSPTDAGAPSFDS